jgi:hypothetical protein
MSTPVNDTTNNAAYNSPEITYPIRRPINVGVAPPLMSPRPPSVMPVNGGDNNLFPPLGPDGIMPANTLQIYFAHHAAQLNIQSAGQNQNQEN